MMELRSPNSKEPHSKRSHLQGRGEQKRQRVRQFVGRAADEERCKKISVMRKSLPGFGSSCSHLRLFCIFKCLEKWVGTFKCKCEKVNKYQTPNLALLHFWLTDEGKCTAWPITTQCLSFYQITFKKASHFGHVFPHSFQRNFFLFYESITGTK